MDLERIDSPSISTQQHTKLASGSAGHVLTSFAHPTPDTLFIGKFPTPSIMSRLVSGITGIILSVAMPLAARAAERFYFDYAPLGISVSYSELETFTKTGTIPPSLKPIMSGMDDGAQQQLRQTLQAQYEVDPVLVNRFSYTSSGQQLLETLGQVMQTESRQNGVYALRAALTLAAANEDGLTILNFLKQLPTDMRVDVAQGLAIAREFSTLLAETNAAMTQLASETDELPTPVSFETLPDPRQPGQWQPSVQTLQLYDEERDRAIAVDLYTPELNPPELQTPDRTTPTTEPIPLIVVSNGLGARRSRFDELAFHLTSHGFAVAMLDHPGSDRQRLQEFYQGFHTENFEAMEFINRPLDVSFLLDELTRLNEEGLAGEGLDNPTDETALVRPLDLEQVGIFGYSFGGTTALALAGADIDRSHLQQACETRSSLFNISLLYQCRALEIPPAVLETQSLRDKRIAATYVYVPFSRSLYGPQGLARVEGPVFWEATEQDILTPLVIEQLPAFSWLMAGDEANDPEADDTSAEQRGDRYLVVSEELPHARLTLDVVNRLTNQSVAWEDIKPITERYHQMLTTVFFQNHLTDMDDFTPYLQAAGMDYLAQEPYELHWRSP